MIRAVITLFDTDGSPIRVGEVTFVDRTSARSEGPAYALRGGIGGALRLPHFSGQAHLLAA